MTHQFACINLKLPREHPFSHPHPKDYWRHDGKGGEGGEREHFTII